MYLRRAQIAIMVWLSISILACQAIGPSPSEKGLSQITQDIVGGTPDSRIPGVGALLGNKQVFCTGTLIAPRIVLTAGHCVAAMFGYESRGLKLEFQIDQPDNQGGIKTSYHAVDYFRHHPSYKRQGDGSAIYDLGFVLLKQPVVDVTPVPINTQTLDASWVGKRLLYLGYGVINANPWTESGNRKYGVEARILSVAPDVVRTLESGKNVCTGDSGGPGLYEINGVYHLMVIVSSVTGKIQSNGRPLCDASANSYRVDAFLRYIEVVMATYRACQKDADCGGCYRCDTNTGKCVDQAVSALPSFCGPCQTDAECGAGGSNICTRTSMGKRCLQACGAQKCCPLGSICDKVKGVEQCVSLNVLCPFVNCQSTGDCGVGEVCILGTCLPKDVDPAPTLCRSCTTDADCGKGACIKYVDGNQCAQPCVADVFCPKGYSCQEVGNRFLCRKTDGLCQCKTDQDCLSGLVCQEQFCKRKGGGVAQDFCNPQRPCATGFACLQQQCIQSCTIPFSVGYPGSSCDGQRCADGARCVDVSGKLQCLLPCTKDSDCKDGGSCVRSDSGAYFCLCRVDSECRNGAKCNISKSLPGACAPARPLPKQCPDGMFCAISPFGSSCVKERTGYVSGLCNDGDPGCKSGSLCQYSPAYDMPGPTCIEYCNEKRQCVLAGGNCTPNGNCLCERDSDCNPGYLCNEISSKLKLCGRKPCKSATDCTGGFVCFEERCQPKPACVKSDECPKGSRCVYRKCVLNEGCFINDDCPNDHTCEDNRCVSNLRPEPALEMSPEPTKETLSDAGLTDVTEPTAETGEIPDVADAVGVDTVVDVPAKQGCGCSAPPFQQPMSWLWLWLLLPLCWRRRPA